MVSSENPVEVLNRQRLAISRRKIANPLTDRIMAVFLSSTVIFLGLYCRYDLKEIELLFWPWGVGLLSIVGIALIAHPRRFNRFWKKWLFAASVMCLFVSFVLTIQFIRYVIIMDSF